MLLLPNQGTGLFAFANLTYAGVAAPVWDAALMLHEAGHLKDRPVPVAYAIPSADTAIVRRLEWHGRLRPSVQPRLERTAHRVRLPAEVARRQPPGRTVVPIPIGGDSVNKYNAHCARPRQGR